MRLSIKDLFGIVTFFIIVAWCVSRVGVANQLFWFVFAATVIMSTAFVCAGIGKESRRFVLLVPVLFLPPTVFITMVALLLVPPTLIFHAILISGAGLFCIIRGPCQLKTLLALAAGCTAVSLGVGSIGGIAAERELMALRAQFPEVDLTDRLNYEFRDQMSNAAKLATNVSADLSTFEGDLDLTSFRSRSRGLQLIHQKSYLAFVRASGFGVGRVRRPSSMWLEFSPLIDIPFTLVQATNVIVIAWRNGDTGDSKDMQYLHDVSRNSFLDLDAFGVKSAKGRVGFVEHGFRLPPDSSVQSLTVVRLELVSLLRFDEPRVYVLDHLPRMDQLRDGEVATRSLDDFELDGLKRLWTQQDLVVRWQNNGYRMLGSLRAASQCLDCHNVRRGALLGAFSYEIDSKHRPLDTDQF
jgi:hypothetical protein